MVCERGEKGGLYKRFFLVFSIDTARCPVRLRLKEFGSGGDVWWCVRSEK